MASAGNKAFPLSSAETSLSPFLWIAANILLFKLLCAIVNLTQDVIDAVHHVKTLVSGRGFAGKYANTGKS